MTSGPDRRVFWTSVRLTPASASMPSASCGRLAVHPGVRSEKSKALALPNQCCGPEGIVMGHKQYGVYTVRDDFANSWTTSLQKGE
jgi:hypothetical protein